MTPLRQPLSLFLVLAVVSFVMLAAGLIDTLAGDSGFGIAGGREDARPLAILALLVGLPTMVVAWAIWPLLRGVTASASMASMPHRAPEAGAPDEHAIGATAANVKGAAETWTSQSGSARQFMAGSGDLGAPLQISAGTPLSVANDDCVAQTYKEAMDHAPTAIVITDRHGRIEYVNDAFLAHVGYERVEVLGRRARLLGAARPGSRVYRDLWQTIIAGRVWRGEMLNRRKNGSEYWERIAVSPLRDASRRISRFIAVCEDVTEHKRREEGLHQLARVDALTGVSNRRHLMERAGHEWVRADRFGLPLALVMLDIDHFKRVNDEYGHAVGDRAICAVATICVDCVREIDIVGRYGGEEFVIVLPGTGLEGARKLGQRLRKRIADVVLEDEEGRPFKLTASLGIADLVGGAGLDRLLASADAALYRAKRSGRNCVVTARHGGDAA